PPIDPALLVVLRQADAALARIEQNQLATLSGNPQAATLLAVQAPLLAQWTLDLPVRDAQYTSVLELGIEEQESAAPASDTVMPWSVWLHFDFERLGKVHARITLRGEEVAATLWAEHEPTAALFQQHLATLEGALRHAGLVPTTVHCQTGKPPRTDEPPAPSSLLDERA
ncbi:MAG TPA: flagellar hook-length control protein FliK, partial [Acidiferrobacterales bacterium]|nr:flagellar hook-length control protein FliK [Acidiferrobacterales bacterium]